MALSETQSRRSIAVFWTVVAAVWFTVWADLSAELLAWDEQIYYDAALSVLEGHWVLPEISAGQNPLGAVSPFLEKPPLAFWIQAGSMAIGGESAAAARFPSILAMSGVVGITVLLACRLSRLSTGVVAGIVGLSIPAFGFIRGATTVAVDPFLLFFGTGAIYCLVVFVETQQTRWGWIAGFGYGGAILAKFAAAAPFGLFTLLYLYRYRRRIEWGGFARVVIGGLIVAAPWFLAVAYLEFQALFDQMIIDQVLERATGQGHGDYGNPIFSFMRYPYFKNLLSYFGWPLIGLGYAAVKSASRKRSGGECSDVDVLMWPFAIGVVVLYAIIGGNHLWYIMPAAVPITILVSDALTTDLESYLENLRLEYVESSSD